MADDRRQPCESASRRRWRTWWKSGDEPTERYDIMGYMQGKFTLEDENGELVYTNGRDRIPAGELTDTIETILDEHSETEWPSDYYSPEEIESMNNALFHIDE